MTERLLQFIWQFQYLNKSELATTAGESVYIIFPGQFNTNQGPDFSNAKIKIGDTTWAGTVELHLQTSDWERHKHQTDKNYRNVILHVVWEDDAIEVNAIPILQLKDRVSKLLLNRYEELMNSTAFIPCEKNIHLMPDIVWSAWKERLMAERLVYKAKLVENYLQQNNYHWEETFWWLLARNFGMTVNADAFEAIARSLPLTILSKHKKQIHQLEALLLGQAGLLDGEFKEDYPIMLKKEYKFLKNKYKLRPVAANVYFLRMRPGNFPTIRLAQLAMLVSESVHLLSTIKESGSVNDVKIRMDLTANDYWHYHYRFDTLSGFKHKNLGSAMIDNIIINSVVPVLFAYGNYHAEGKYKLKALEWLESTEPENNSITRGFELLGIENKNAYDSQAIIELKTHYCDVKRCLECSVGNFLLKASN
jgi:Protein of unknown function (DUF2851)